MDFLGLQSAFYGTDYKKGTFFSHRLKKKERRTLHLRSILQSEKKNGINLKRTWCQSYISLFVNCFNFLSRMFRRSKFKTGRTLRRKKHYLNAQKLNLPTDEYKASHPLHNKSFTDFTDLFGSVELIFRIFNFDFSLKC